MVGRIIGIIRKPFVRNVVIMVSGTAVAQIIAMLSVPLITRIYGPGAYGMMGVFTAIITIVSPIAALTFPMAIVLPKKDEEAKGLVRLSLYFSLLMAIIVSIILLLFQNQIVNLLKIKVVASFLFLVPIVMVLSSLFQVFEQWLIRIHQFKVNANVAFLQSLILNGSKIGFGIIYPVASVLIVITSLGDGVKAIIMMLFLKKTEFKPYNFTKEVLILKNVMKKYIDFPLFRAPQTLINSISESIPILMLTTFYGPFSVGFFSIGRTVLNMPTQLISKSVGNVFYPRISEAANNQENLSLLIKKATIGLIGVGIIPFGSIILFGPWVFSLVFGEDWIMAGEYARWISLWSFSTFILQPCVRTLPVINAQAFHLKYTVISLTVRFISLAVGYYIFSNDLVSVALFGASSGLMNIILMVITLRIIQHNGYNKNIT